MRDVTEIADRRLDRALLNICLALAFGFTLAVAYRLISVNLALRMANRQKP